MMVWSRFTKNTELGEVLKAVKPSVKGQVSAERLRATINNIKGVDHIYVDSILNRIIGLLETTLANKPVKKSKDTHKLIRRVRLLLKKLER